MVLGHSQYEESHMKNRIGNHICIASYQPTLSLCKALTNNPISQQDNGLQCRRDT